MSYLLDTNVVSEAKRQRPDPNVSHWLSSHQPLDSYLSVITLGEIQEGISYLGKTKKAKALAAWLETLKLSFSGRILPVDAEVISLWGELRGNAKRKGRPVPVVDALLAATAITHDLTLVTRNVKDITTLPVNVLNPWEEPGKL